MGFRSYTPFCTSTQSENKVECLNRLALRLSKGSLGELISTLYWPSGSSTNPCLKQQRYQSFSQYFLSVTLRVTKSCNGRLSAVALLRAVRSFSLQFNPQFFFLVSSFLFPPKFRQLLLLTTALLPKLSFKLLSQTNLVEQVNNGILLKEPARVYL